MIYSYTKLIKGNAFSYNAHANQLKQAKKSGDGVAITYHQRWCAYYQGEIARYRLLQRVTGDEMVLQR